MATIDLFASVERDTILEVRRGKMKHMSGLKIESGIDKNLCKGAVWVGKQGIQEDEHDLTFHGGVDKAVHGYCKSHYPSWQSEFPSAASRFVPGGFGENLVTAHMNERNVCIGDIYAIGTGDKSLMLQVSLPRQPCFKLNHRFQLKNFAPNTWKLSRTGWYYRVLREGPLQTGDEIRLVERKWPEWTIERIQEYLHRDKDVLEINEALAAIPELGDESRKAFEGRVTRAKAKTEKKTEVKWTDYRVVGKKQLTRRITSFDFEAVNSRTITDQKPDEGSHVKIKLPNGLVRAYSVVDGSAGRFQLGIALEERSRGGSKYLHQNVNVGDTIQVDKFTPGIKFNAMASNHVFIVGGVGITAFLWLAETMMKINWSVQIHYALRSTEEMPFRERLERFGDRLVVYDKMKSERLDVGNIVRSMPWNSQLYVCGPRRLMDETSRIVKEAVIGEGEVHFEAFEADVGGDPFEVEVEGKKGTLQVKEEETLLEVLQREFGDIPSSCEVGNCGTCKVKVKCGKVEHRGTALTAEEKKDSMLSCVSRGVGRIAIEI
ncbi:MOSC domain-containing protein [Lophiotrema nucula]|uniref:MOSC domain-containing protein n=1 Tax=Lophiotrema nucula TaxID=690887 RepID=A0A6A5YIF4_9PLEO|nr:MOSC domain-containing protein [Lophiotrema nucula]